MSKGPKKGSKKYICRNERCEKYGKPQYIQPWGVIRCKACGSEDIEEAGEKEPAVPEITVPAADTEPTAPETPAENVVAETATEEVAPSEADVPKEEFPDHYPAEEEVGNETVETGLPPAPPPQKVIAVEPKKGDLVECEDCNWAVHWDPEYHRKIECHACHSKNLRIARPAGGV